MKRYWYKTNLTKTILVVMEHILAVVMVVSFLWMLSYPALREEIFEGEPARRYEDSRGFATLVESRSTQALEGISASEFFGADGALDEDKIVDVGRVVCKWNGSGREQKRPCLPAGRPGGLERRSVGKRGFLRGGT